MSDSRIVARLLGKERELLRLRRLTKAWEERRRAMEEAIRSLEAAAPPRGASPSGPPELGRSPAAGALPARRPGVPRVFGIGLSRTGTQSLSDALRILGYRSAHWEYTEGVVGCDGERLSIELDKLEPYDALCDIPIARFFREIDRAFPGARFVLTRREPSGWLESMRRHLARMDAEASWTERSRRLHQEIYGTLGFDADRLAAGHARHIAAARTHFEGRERDLLVLDLCAGAGWEPLCEFLDRPVPPDPFPAVRA